MAPLYAILVFFSQLCGLLGKSIVQPNPLVTARPGDTVNFQCFHPQNDVSYISWLKQPLGQKPQLVVTTTKYQTDGIFSNEFKNSSRLSARVSKGNFHLTVSQVEPSDSATYYCATSSVKGIRFGDGCTLMVMGSKSRSRTAVLQQPESESVQPGDSVTLQCTVPTETCAGEHSVYWFRQSSAESPPGIIYTHGNRSDESQRSPGAVSPTQSCVYSLPKRNLGLSDAGTYYCAVLTCGEILFGNGTKLDFKGNGRLPLYCMAGALMFSVILNVFCMVLALNRRTSSEYPKGAASNVRTFREDSSSAQCQEETMNYAALTFNTKKPKVRRNKREVESVAVYSDIRFKDHK